MNATAPANQATNQHIVGAITGLYGDVLQGWALDRNSADERLVVEIHIDGACVCVARADQFQGNGKGELEGDGFHGFAVALQKNWLNGAEVIAVRVANHAIWLANTLQLPSVPPTEPGPAASQVWYSGGLTVTGWAWDSEAPTRHVGLSAREGGRVIARASANEHHPALIYRDTADHGFRLDLPWELGDGERHEVHIEDDQGEPLTGSPIQVCFRPEGIEALLRQNWPGSPDDPALALLTRLAADQDRRAPRSIPFSLYHEWFELFQQSEPPPAEAPTQRVGVLLLVDGERDASREAISLASIKAQRWPVQMAVRADADNVLPALKRLLESGVDAIIPLHSGDRLPAYAVDHLLPLLEDETAWAFADCDQDGTDGRRTNPWLKPVWDIDLFIGADIFSSGAIYGTPLVRDAMTLATAESAQCDWPRLTGSIALLTEQSKLRVIHLPRVLYHRHSAAVASPADLPEDPSRQRAMQWLVQNLAAGASMSALPRFPGLLRAHWPLPPDDELPRVSLIVPTRDHYKLLHSCVEGLLTKTDYPNLEIIVVDNQSTCPDTLRYMEELVERGVVILRHPYPFNYSAINNRAVEHATGEIIGLINNDIEVIHDDWLREMVSHLLRPNVGIVGAKLLWPNGMVQHGGVVVGINGLAAHTGNTWHKDDAGYLGFNQLARQQSAVTAACLLTSKQLYQRVRLDDTRFPINFNDVDFSLRAQRRLIRVLWTAHACASHAESASRGKDAGGEKAARALREQAHALEDWKSVADPHYHPALSHTWSSAPFQSLDANSLNKLSRSLTKDSL